MCSSFPPSLPLSIHSPASEPPCLSAIPSPGLSSTLNHNDLLKKPFRKQLVSGNPDLVFISSSGGDGRRRHTPLMAAAESGSAVGIAAVCDVLDAAVKRAEEREAAALAGAEEGNGNGGGGGEASSPSTAATATPPTPPQLSSLARRGSAAALSEPGLLAMAAMHGTRQHLEALEELLLRGADCLTPNGRGDNPLHAAARAGRSASLRALLSSRVAVTSSGGSDDGSDEATPPPRVARLGDLVVPRDSWAGRSSSSSSSSSSSQQPATRLIDARGPHGLSPLDLAVLSGSAPSVATLVRDAVFGERERSCERRKGRR